MNSEWVRPALDLKPQSVHLAPFEQYAPRWWMAITLAFSLSLSSSPQQVYTRLQEGLSRTLVEYPLLAGRIENIQETDGKVLIRVPEGSAAGVEFSWTEYSGTDNGDLPTYEELKAQHFSTSSLSAAFGVDLLRFPEIIHGSRVFLARATFIKGGVLLTLGVTHALVDGEAFAAIQRTWARNVRESDSAVDLATLNPFPCQQTRSRLFEGNDNGTVCKDGPYSIRYKDRNCTTGAYPFQMQKLPEAETSSYVQRPFTSEKSTRSIWYFSPEKLRQLKMLASPAPDVDQIHWISTFDALTAFFWHRSAIARRLRDRGFVNAKCFVSMNVRSRVEPPLHPDFLGNASDLVRTQHCSAELEESSDWNAFHNLLPILARQVRAAIRGWNQADYQSLIGLVSSGPPDKILDLEIPTDDPGLLVTDTSKTATYSTDWGAELGFPEASRFLILDPGIPLSIVLILPQLPNGGLEILTFLPHEAMQKLEGDEVFTAFAEFRGA